MNKTKQELSGDVLFDIVQDHISDMEIKPGVDYLIINQNIRMKSSRKSFPDVKKLIINDNVEISKFLIHYFQMLKRLNHQVNILRTEKISFTKALEENIENYIIHFVNRKER